MDRKELLTIIAEAAEKRSTKLDLSKEGIADVPPEIGKLTNLQWLDLSGNELTSMPPEVGQLTNLRHLNLGWNELISLPLEIRALTNLRVLDLTMAQLTSLPPEIAQLTKLQVLDLEATQLTALPREIGVLTNLRELNLPMNRLTSLPPEIGQLTNLQMLDLGENQLTSLPPEIAKLTNLQALHLGHNELTSFPPEISAMKKLRELDLGGNQLTSLPHEVGELTNLQMLFIWGNQLKSLPPGISQLTNLRGLDLRHNQLRLLPQWILELSLDLNPRELQDVALIPGGIALRGNPLERPPMEIVAQGREAVRRYFASLKEGKRVLNEVKVLLVGDGGAGKTSLVKRLLTDEFDPEESQTHGVNIDDWSVTSAGAKICAHIWDFGGQVIMHSTHQFFLSRRSLYVLVLDGRKEEDAEYWLKHIESFGGDSPILVVLNKMDENPGFDVNRRFLQSKYKGIQDFFRVSCKTSKGIAGLRKAIIESLPEVGITSTTWPEKWVQVKRRLEKMERSFISYDKYVAMCEEERIPDEADQDTLVKFLHDLGVVVHFPDFRLRHMHVLDPRWLTTAVYRIINSEALAEDKGLLKLSSLIDILSSNDDGFSYPAEQHRYIVDIMEKFELCLRIGDDRILVPDLLEVQEPEIDFDYDSSLRFRIDYDFLPKSIIPRFIVKKHAEIKGELRWRTGVVLKSEAFAATAVVTADETAKRIYIAVAGPQTKDYLTVLRSVFLETNRAFQKLRYTERIPLPDDPEVAVSYDHLLRLEKEGQENYYPEGAKRSYRVKELLGTVYVERKLTVDDFFVMLQQVVKDTDEKRTILQKANRIIMLQPNIFGVGVNLNELVDDFIKWCKKLAKRRKRDD